MTLAGWIFMLASVTFVVSMVIFCFVRVLRNPGASEHLSAPPERDTRNRDV